MLDTGSIPVSGTTHQDVGMVAYGAKLIKIGINDFIPMAARLKL